MKKYFSFAIALATIALLMTACPGPEPTPEPGPDGPVGPDTTEQQEFAQNYIIDYVNAVKNLVGQTSAVAQQKVTASVWQAVDGVPNIFLYVGTDYASEVHLQVSPDDVVYKVTLSVYPNKNEGHQPMLTAAYIKDAVKKFSNEITIETDHVCRFYAAYTQVGEVWAKNTEEFAKYMDESRLNNSKTIWLDNNIGRYNAEDESRFIGMKMICNKFDIDGNTVQEYSVAIDLTDNTIINPE